MSVTKEDVQKALHKIGDDLPEENGSSTENDDVQKAGGSVAATGSEVPSKDLNTSNGAADKEGSLKVPQGENMNDKYGNKKEKGTKKSLPEFEDDLPPEVETKVEVSEFLKSLVDHTANQVNGLRDFVVKSDEASEARTDDLIDMIEDVQKSQANIGIVLKAVCEKIGIIENEPEVRKSATSAAAPVERTFENPVQASQEAGKAQGNNFYKSLEGKSPLDVKKSMSAGMIELVKKGELDQTDVINFETYGYVSPEADAKLRPMFS